MTSKPGNENRANTVLWIVLIMLVVTSTASIGVLLWLSRSKPKQTTATSQPRASAPATSFADLTEADLAGRYKIDDGGKVMYIVLNEDHSFINQDGTTYPTYEWQSFPDRLIITWQRSSSTFTRFEAPGVYSRQKTEGGVMRMMKLPDLPPADKMGFGEQDVVAWLSFTNGIESSGMTLAHTDADGAIQPVEAAGEACHQLVRQRNRMSAFLYGRIAPELKTPAFTNAFVMVEYLDTAASDPRNGWISLQFDSPEAPYTSTAQRVQLEGTMKWKRATFVLDGPAFEGRQNDGGDFRLCVAAARLPVRSIKLIKNRPLPR
jgi:hypothetical protein